ncbi:MAG: hypothetical protein ABIR34_10045 [Marmoricola sp.]
MSTFPESPVLGSVPVDVRPLAGQAAAGPGMPVASVNEVVRLHLDASEFMLDIRAPDPRCARVRMLVGGRPSTVNIRRATMVLRRWSHGAPEAPELCRSWTEDRIDAR